MVEFTVVCMGLEVACEALSVGSGDDALSAFQLEANTTLVVHLGKVYLTVHGIVEHNGFCPNA